MQWTRTNIRVIRFSHTSDAAGATRRSQFAIAEAVPYLPALSLGEPLAGAQSAVDEGLAAHELRLPDEERSPGEPQAEVQPVDEGPAAHEP
jgi:hypothetical protein